MFLFIVAFSQKAPAALRVSVQALGHISMCAHTMWPFSVQHFTNVPQQNNYTESVRGHLSRLTETQILSQWDKKKESGGQGTSFSSVELNFAEFACEQRR